MRDLSIWVELTPKKRKCHKCGEDIEAGSMMVRVGEKGISLKTTNLCAACFETMMNKLTDDFHALRGSEAVPVEHNEERPRCFSCGLRPEQCTCGSESYR